MVLLLNGQKEPIVVRPIGEDTYQLVSGERRLRASQKKGLLTIKAIVKEIRDEDLHFESLSYNAGRHKLTPRETFFAIVKEVDAGRSIKDIAGVFCKSEGWVRTYLSLRNLAPELQAILEHDTKKDCLLIKDALELAKITNLEYQVKRYQSTKDLTPSVRKKLIQNDVKRLRREPKQNKTGENRRWQVEDIISSTENFYYFLMELSAMDKDKLISILESIPSLKREELEERIDECVTWLGSLSKNLNNLNA
ncbi:MAG: ParB-like protein partition protein [Parcubacteria group bacterium GW2011_GWD2_42_14]|nr:MAG: ParB-like protein partition protein [Parcubacteria group bacterium GW2011_GWD2_42_14]